MGKGERGRGERKEREERQEGGAKEGKVNSFLTPRNPTFVQNTH